MLISELIANLTKAKAEHGDAEVGYYASPGAASWASVEQVEYRDIDEYLRRDHPDVPERWVLDLFNGGS